MSHGQTPESHSAVQELASAHEMLHESLHVIAHVVVGSQSTAQPVAQSNVQSPRKQLWLQPLPSHVAVHEAPSQS
jgi:hypothetical protein